MIIRPKDLPKPHHFLEGKLALERNEYPAEAEEEVQRVGLFEVPVQLGIHHGEELLQGRELFLHPALISQEVNFLTRRVSMRGRRGTRLTYHAIHDRYEAPERQDLVSTAYDIDRRAEIRHALHITFRPTRHQISNTFCRSIARGM